MSYGHVVQDRIVIIIIIIHNITSEIPFVVTV